MEDYNILSKEEVIKNGLEFDGDIICFSGEYGEQVYNMPMEDGGKPVDGLIYEKYKNGNINYYCFYQNGIKNGEYVSFYESGILKKHSIMYKGTIHGNSISYFESGGKKSQAQHKYGYDISYIEWNEEGTLVKEQTQPSDFAKTMIEKYDGYEAQKFNE